MQEIEKAISRGFLRHDDLEKLDFSMPGEAGYGDDPEFEVFNPSGPFNAARPPDWKQNSVMFTPDTKTVFILRRISDEGRDSAVIDHLLVVITDLNKEGCTNHRRYSSIVKLPEPLDLTPHSKGPISDPHIQKIMSSWNYFNQCVVDSNNKWYYIEPLVSRHKPSSSDDWWRDRYHHKYIGWKGNTSVVHEPRNLDLKNYTHSPPPTIMQRIAKAGLMAAYSFVWFVWGIWVLSILRVPGSLMAKYLPDKFSYLGTGAIWLCMGLPIIFLFSKGFHLSWISGLLVLGWFACAATAYALFRYQKTKLVFNLWVNILFVTLSFLAFVSSQGTCSSNIFWPF